MPGGDRTGPVGYGPLTGRRAGFCGGYAVPGYLNAGFRGMGRGGGFGGGHGQRHRHWYYATGLPGWARGWGADANAPVSRGGAAPGIPEEAAMLKEQAAHLERTLQDIKTRLAELAGAAAEGRDEK